MVPFPDSLTAGALLLAAGSYAFSQARQGLGFLWTKLWSRCVSSVEILNHTELYEAALTWLDRHPKAGRFRQLSICPEGKGYLDPAASRYIATSDKEPPRVVYSLAPGSHLLWHHGRPVWIRRERESPTQTGFRPETLHLTYFGGPDRLRSLVQEILSHIHQKKNQVEVFGPASWAEHGWERLSSRQPRELESVILPVGVGDRVLQDCTHFWQSAALYQQQGIPYRRGYLLHGMPGAGKTSLIFAIAGRLGSDVFLLSLSQGNLTDISLLRLLSQVPVGTVLLLEDVDCLFQERKGEEAGKGVTFSGLLNAIDGIAAPEGLLLFMTTNHREKLDPALIRPGRVDYELEFGPATREQAEQLYDRFFPDRPERRSSFAAWATESPRPMAELQQRLLFMLQEV